jgi:dCTP deaminase
MYHPGPMIPRSLLGKTELKKLLLERSLIVEPLLDPEKQIDETGVDLRLDCFFREFVRTQNPYVTPAESAEGATVLREIEPFRESFYLQPGEFALAQSLEYIGVPRDAVGILNGRSSLGRRGLIVHATANIVDPGWRGHLVFELANLGTMPIQLVPLMRVAKLIFFRTEVLGEYEGPYAGQIRITAPPADDLVVSLQALALKAKAGKATPDSR